MYLGIHLLLDNSASSKLQSSTFPVSKIWLRCSMAESSSLLQTILGSPLPAKHNSRGTARLHNAVKMSSGKGKVIDHLIVTSAINVIPTAAAIIMIIIGASHSLHGFIKAMRITYPWWVYCCRHAGPFNFHALLLSLASFTETLALLGTTRRQQCRSALQCISCMTWS